MSKIQSRFICQKCGYESPRWLGRCHSCGEYGTLTEEPVTQRKGGRSSATVAAPRVYPLNAIEPIAHRRLQTDSNQGSVGQEFDRVLGGGLVPGSLTLVGGEPGIGKSTLLLQVLGGLGRRNVAALYLSGEESPEQIGLRAERLQIAADTVFVAGETDIRAIEAALNHCRPQVAVIDSIQTVNHPDLDSAAGTISQVRESTAALVRLAKESSTAMALVGHVTKDGAIAGPKAVEHMVDAVLTFEGDPHHTYRILRATKNRFGSTHEAGIFEMRADGLVAVENPSQLFLHESQCLGEEVSGSCVTACLEGTRPVLGEVQALVTPSYYGTPRRMATGADYNRCCVILAVLEKRVGLHLGNQDVHVNVAGGLRVTEPAADLAIALACVSSFRDQPMPAGAIVFGEIGLGGEIRGVPHASRRVEEASRLGFKQCVLPQSNLSAAKDSHTGMKLVGVRNIEEAMNRVLG